MQTSVGFRIVSWTRDHAQLALIDVGATEWHGPRDTPRGFMEESVGDIAYGYMRYGFDPERARRGYALKYEWPTRGGEEQAVLNPSATSWWDEYIPDAFELQLLGPGFARRIPPTPSCDQA